MCTPTPLNKIDTEYCAGSIFSCLEYPRLLEVGMLHPGRYCGGLWRTYFCVSCHNPASLCRILAYSDLSWAQEICRRDSEERAIVIGTMNTMGQIVQVWLPLIVFQQVQAPRYYEGWITLSVLNICTILTTIVMWWLEKNENGCTSTTDEEVLRDSKTVEMNVKAK